MKKLQIQTALALSISILLLSCRSQQQTTTAHSQTNEIQKQLDSIIINSYAIEKETIWLTKTDTAGRTTTATMIKSRQITADAKQEKQQTQTTTTIKNQRETSTDTLPPHTQATTKNTFHWLTLIFFLLSITCYLFHSSKH